ncbi:hypothetical protein MOO44_07835 [Nicoliella spurrieriana]|uniref:Uncharacterized protein n=1 Tax=Nicoliella spurrieriana TaxID=2925830 RepID=A0A976RS26_9LACO|nr:hypothetical protein [Nicoliella spurrieriana]UQS86768.1 hypothetical protein MOO44_07835 [Nicoliella spurrieriana]
MTLIATMVLLLLTTLLLFQITAMNAEIRTNHSIIRDYQERGATLKNQQK